MFYISAFPRSRDRRRPFTTEAIILKIFRPAYGTQVTTQSRFGTSPDSDLHPKFKPDGKLWPEIIGNTTDDPALRNFKTNPCKLQKTFREWGLRFVEWKRTTRKLSSRPRTLADKVGKHRSGGTLRFGARHLADRSLFSSEPTLKEGVIPNARVLSSERRDLARIGSAPGCWFIEGHSFRRQIALFRNQSVNGEVG